jgi:iron(III) transport system substrate-binding protein
MLAWLLLAGCGPAREKVVAYTALDRTLAEPILSEFTADTNIEVLATYDVEGAEPVSLTEAIIDESNHPRCDVFWTDEILDTLRLEERGLLAVYESPIGQEHPEAFRAVDGKWYGLAARARILLVNTEVVPEDQRPKSIYDLADEKWRGQIGIATPTAAASATHAACLFASIGEEKAKEFFQKLKANEVQIFAGDKEVAQAVAVGKIAFGLTDTGDAIIELEQGNPVNIVYPDRNPGELGTLFIPSSVCIIQGAPHADAARRLVDFILRPETEIKLANGPRAKIPLHPKAAAASRVQTPRTVKAMTVNFREAAQQAAAAAKYIRDEFTPESKQPRVAAGGS